MYEIVLLELTCLEGRPVNQDHTRSAQGFHLNKPPATPVNIYYVSQVRGSRHVALVETRLSLSVDCDLSFI
jgi:hypothetical protein